MIKELIRSYAKGLHIEYTGFTSLGSQRAIVFLFPYYVMQDPSANLSLYTYAKDYHLIAGMYLKRIIGYLQNTFGTDYVYTPYVDISPYNEKDLAVKAGLGVRGRNTLVINEKYGTFCFIGFVLTDLPFEPEPPQRGVCMGCGKCVAACPTGALKNYDFDLCLSQLTQKKRDFTPSEHEAMEKSSLAFGCDICQLVCPMNSFAVTPLTPFKEELLTRLSLPDLEALSQSKFRSLYRSRAFSWRGKNILVRNLKLLRGKRKPPAPSPEK